MPEWTFEERYGRLFRSHGVGTYPNALGEFQARLGLSGDECWLIVRLFSYRWTDRAPYPSERRLAKHMGIARSTVQRIVRGLEAKGLIEVERRTASSGAKITSLYRLEPLLRRLEELVDEESRSVAIAQRIPRFGIVSTLSRSALPSVAEQQILPLEEGGGPPAGHPRPTCGPPPARRCYLMEKIHGKKRKEKKSHGKGHRQTHQTVRISRSPATWSFGWAACRKPRASSAV